MNEEYTTVLEQYKNDLKCSQEAFLGFKKKMAYARQAYNGKIPADIKGAASNEALLTVYETSTADRDNRGNDSGTQSVTRTCSKMLLPMFKAICKKMIENMTAIPPRYEWAANTKDYVKVSRLLEKELAKSYTRKNLSGKNPRIITNFVRDGIFVQQTVFEKMLSEAWKFKDGRKAKEEIYNKGSIDFRIYDPMTTYFDWDADPLSYRDTARYIIVTTNSEMTYGAFKAKYPKYEKQVNGSTGQTEDQLKSNSGNDIHGLVAPTAVVTVREYYTNDGMFYVVVNDAVIVDSGTSSNGDASRIPINVGFCYDDYITLWEELKWPVAAMSNAFNQVADNNAFNNTAPIFMLGNCLVDPLAMDPADGTKMYTVDSVGKEVRSIQDAMMKFQIPEVTNGAQFMYDKAKEALFYVTGTTDLSFGIQDKQIRVKDAADMISNALVRSDSAIAKRIESSFYNPVTWDILLIFYTRYDDFDFKDKGIPEEFLKNHRNLRVVNGSYLPADQMVRQGKLQEALRIAELDPSRANLENLFYDLYDAVGFADPYRYLMTNEEFAAQDQASTVMKLLEAGAITEEQAEAAMASIKLITDNKEKFQEQ